MNLELICAAVAVAIIVGMGGALKVSTAHNAVIAKDRDVAIANAATTAAANKVLADKLPAIRKQCADATAKLKADEAAREASAHVSHVEAEKYAAAQRQLIESYLNEALPEDAPGACPSTEHVLNRLNAHRTEGAK